MTDDETRQRMVDAALGLIEAQNGLTVSLGHLSFEDIISSARVSRSAAYRLWPYKEAFFGEVIVELAGLTAPGRTAYDDGTLDVAFDVVWVHRHRLGTPEGRRWIFIEACRLGSEQNFRSLLASNDWQSYIALNATLSSVDERDDVRKRTQQTLIESEAQFLELMSRFYASMCVMLGLRFRINAPNPGQLLAVLGGAVIEGLALNLLVNPTVSELTFEADPFGVGTATWTMASLGFAAVVNTVLEVSGDLDIKLALGTLAEVRKQRGRDR